MDIKTRRKHLDAFDYLIRIVLTAVILIFVLYPFLFVFFKALYYRESWNLSAFSFLLKENHLIKNSLLSALLTSLLSTTFAISIAISSLFLGQKQRKVLLLILMMTMVSPPFISPIVYIELFGRNGFITKEILHLSINPYGLTGIVLMQTLTFTPLSAILLLGHLDNIDKTMIEAARSLRATTSSIIFEIVIPLINSAIFVSFLLSFIRSLSDFITPTIIGGAFNTLATESYLSIIAKGNSSRASAISVILFIPSIIIFIMYYIFTKRQQSGSKSFRESEVTLKKTPVFYIIAVLAGFFVLWIIIQYSAIFISAITDKHKGKTFFTLANIASSLPYVKDSLVRTIGYSLLSSIVACLIGLLLAYYSYIKGKKTMKVVDFIANMPYIVPGTFFGIGYIFAFNKPPLELTGTTIIIILNLIFRQLPLSIRAIQNSMTQIQEATVSSAKDLGAHDLFVIKDIIFPMSRSGLFLAFTNSFISSMTTIGSIIFLIYPSKKLITMVLFDLVSSGKYKIASVLSCMLILICFSVSLLSHKIINWKGGKNA